jgi:hypothetical protein
MIFSEAVAEVVAITKRPDKEVEIKSNLNKAITFFVLKDTFQNDLVETSLPIDPLLLGQTIDISMSTPPLLRIRKFDYIRPRGQRYCLEEIKPEQLFTPKGYIQPNRYYLAGNNLTFTLSVPDSFLEVGYFVYPPVLTTVTGSDRHWLLDNIPWAVIEWAASQTFQSIGDDASARYYQASAMVLFNTMKNDISQP